MSSGLLTRTILVFWALWLWVVSASNAVDALAPGSPFASGNLALVAEALSVYAVPRAAAAALFALVLLLEVAAATLFGRAALDPDPSKVLAPFLVAILLFCGFLVFDELLLVYRRFPSLAPTHFSILSALLLSLLVIRALDDRRGT